MIDRSQSAGLLSMGCLIALSLSTTLAVAQAPPPSPVSAAKVIVDTPVVKRSFVGTVRPYRMATIGSAVDGRVEGFPFRPGDIVEANAAVTELKTDTIGREIEIAGSELELRAAELDEMQREETVAFAKAKMETAKARAEFAAARRTRYEQLHRRGETITAEEYELAVTQSLEADGTLAAMQADYLNMTQGVQIDKIAQAAARKKTAAEAVALLETKKYKHTLRSPFRGVVTKTFTEVGEWLSQGEAAVEVIDIEQVEVEFGVPEQYIARIMQGADAQLAFNAIPGESVPGKVTTIVPQGDLQTRTFPVRILLKNKVRGSGAAPDWVYRPGMFCTVTIELASVTKVLVPKDALVVNQDSTVIYVIRISDPPSATGVAELIPVKQGESSGNYIEVLGAAVAELTADDLVVVAGNERLRPMQPVRHRVPLNEYQSK